MINLLSMEGLAPILSFISIGISIFTAWFTIFRRGTIRCAQPTFIAFRYDFLNGELPQAKIFMRALLFSTGKRGVVLESLFLRVKEGARFAEFSFWGHGDKDLIRGSGHFVGENGTVSNHHFNPIQKNPLFKFTAGTYEIELLAKIAGRKEVISLSKAILPNPAGAFDQEILRDTAVYFNWSFDQMRYIASIEKR